MRSAKEKNGCDQIVEFSRIDVLDKQEWRKQLDLVTQILDNNNVEQIPKSFKPFGRQIQFNHHPIANLYILCGSKDPTRGVKTGIFYRQCEDNKIDCAKQSCSIRLTQNESECHQGGKLRKDWGYDNGPR